MDIEERIEIARKELGVGTRRPKKPKPKKGRPRKLSSMVKSAQGKNSEVTRKEMYKQCSRKRRYRSEHEARLFANRAETKRGPKLRVYWCPICEGWHITSKTGGKE